MVRCVLCSIILVMVVLTSTTTTIMAATPISSIPSTSSSPSTKQAQQQQAAAAYDRIPSAPAEQCTAITVGRKASKDGSTMTTHTDDCIDCGIVTHPLSCP
jgi:hypothetical protein